MSQTPSSEDVPAKVLIIKQAIIDYFQVQHNPPCFEKVLFEHISDDLFNVVTFDKEEFWWAYRILFFENRIRSDHFRNGEYYHMPRISLIN